MLTNDAKLKLNAALADNIVYGEYMVDGVWHRAQASNDVKIRAGKSICVCTFFMDGAVIANKTVTAVRLLNVNGAVYAQRSTSIVRADSADCAYVYMISFDEMEE